MAGGWNVDIYMAETVEQQHYGARISCSENSRPALVGTIDGNPVPLDKPHFLAGVTKKYCVEIQRFIWGARGWRVVGM